MFYREALERSLERLRDAELRTVCKIIFGVVLTVIARCVCVCRHLCMHLHVYISFYHITSLVPRPPANFCRLQYEKPGNKATTLHDPHINKSDISCLKNQLGTIQVKYPRLSSATGETKLATVA